MMQQSSFPPPPQNQQSPYQQPASYQPYYGQPGYMPVQPVARDRNAFKYGLIFGGILALLSLCINALGLTPVGPLIFTPNPWLTGRYLVSGARDRSLDYLWGGRFNCCSPNRCCQNRGVCLFVGLTLVSDR